MSAIAGSIISGASQGTGDIVGNWIGNYIQSAANRHQRQFIQDENTRAWERTQEMWEYNNPTNQMQRLREAGLNPSLIYGMGSQATGLATGGPKQAGQGSNTTKGVSISPFDPLGKFFDLQQKEANVDNTRALGQKITAETGLIEVTKTLSELDKLIKQTKFNEYDQQAWALELRQTAEQINKIIQETNLTKLKSIWEDRRLDYQRRTGLDLNGSNMVNTLLKIGVNWWDRIADNTREAQRRWGDGGIYENGPGPIEFAE